MSRENKILLLTLTLMVGASIGLLLINRSSDTSVDPEAFRVNGQEEIDRVQLITPTDTIALRYTGARWQVNETFAADRRMVKVFFATLDQVRPVRTVTGAEADSAKRWLQQWGVTTTLYKQGESVFQFQAGGNPNKTLAYFLHPTGTVYAMHIPGYRVYASGIFETNLNTWREKRLFDFNWQNFKALALTSRESGNEFEISYNGTAFGIANTETDTARLNSYLDEVSLMTADAFYQPGSAATWDSTLLTPPAFEMRVQDVGSREYRLEVFAPAPRAEAILARLNGEPLLLSREKAAALAKKKSYFLRTRTR